MDRPRHLRCRVCPVGVALVAVGVASAAVAQDAPAGLRQQAGELVERLEGLAPASLESLLARAATVDTLPAGVSFLARFPGPLAGLHVGAPVLAQGIRIGTVREVVVAFARGATEVPASVVVTLDIVPDRVVLDAARPTSDEALRAAVEALVARGLHARVTGGSAMLGEAAVEPIRDPAAPPPTASVGAVEPELPTLQLEQMGADLVATAQALHELVAAPDLRTALASLAATADLRRGLVARLAPEVTAALAELGDAARAARVAAERASVSVASLDGTVGPKAPLWSELRSVLREVGGATRGLRLLVDYLDRHPDALIRGRTGAAP